MVATGGSLDFDLGQLFRAIDQARLDRAMTWAALARDVGVASSTIRRFESAADAEADGVLTLIGWVGVPPERFIAGTAVPEVMLPPLEGGLIRADMGLVAEAAGDLQRKRVGARTSIQRLVAVAQNSSQSVASLTRWSAL
jgi:hypothetical protein